jgi:hypothetical protein
MTTLAAQKSFPKPVNKDVPIEKPSVEGLIIVLAGSFNPRIFDPWWFAKQRLIQDEEAEKAEVGVITAELALFSIGWLRLQAEAERVQISTSQPQYYDAVRDFVLGTFRILRHTPVKGLGFHWMAHFPSTDKEDWHAIGDRLAPKDLWRDVLKEPGLLKMVMRETRTLHDWTNVTFEPSAQVQPGIYFEVYDHYDIVDSDTPLGADVIMKTLEERWTNSLSHSRAIMTDILKKTHREQG